MPSNLDIPLLTHLAPLGFKYSAGYLVEFEADSVWYETSLTITAQALKGGIKTEYHTFMHNPNKIREGLTNLGLNVKKLEQDDLLRIIDSYTVTTGLGIPEETEKVKGRHETHSFNVVDWSIGFLREMKEGFDEAEKRWLHIDDNTSVLDNYTDEKTLLNVWRTRAMPWLAARELLLLNSFVVGVQSESFYRQLELLFDGIIDFKKEEKGGQIEHHVRVRLIRGKTYDSQWRRLNLQDNGEVVLSH